MTYILDTSAILAYLSKEAGGEKLKGLKKDSAIPFMALAELYYLTWQKKGKPLADMVYGVVKGWQMPVLQPDEKTILTAGRFKVNYKLGIADSFMAAFAYKDDCCLVTKDQDFSALKNEIAMLYL